MSDVSVFDAMAGSYDELEPWYDHLYARLHAIIRAELRPPSGAAGPRALDAGCGTGYQTALLEALGYRSHGVDLSAGLLAVARARRPAASFARATLAALPYADACFDVVTCCGSTLSFVDDPAAALGEIGRVLRPGGRLLLECERKWSLDLGWTALSAVTADGLGYGVSARELWRALARPLGESCVLPYREYGRLWLFTGRDLRRYLAEAGLAVERAWGIHAATALLPSSLLHRAHLPRGLRALYRRLCELDRWLAPTPVGVALASSTVLLARRQP